MVGVLKRSSVQLGEPLVVFLGADLAACVPLGENAAGAFQPGLMWPRGLARCDAATRTISHAAAPMTAIHNSIISVPHSHIQPDQPSPPI